MAIDKLKIKELILRKKELDKEQVDLQAKQQVWNNEINSVCGSKNISWDDLLLKVLSDD